MSKKKQETCLVSRDQYKKLKFLHSRGASYKEMMHTLGLNMTQVMRFLKQQEKERK